MDKEFNRSWTRFHDDPRTVLLNQVPEVDYPDGLNDLIALCRDRPPEVRLRAAGSHWALSEAAISDHTFIETHDQRELKPAMDRTLLDVVPGCLHPELLQALKDKDSPASKYGTLIHVESGKRIYQLYAELDQVDDGSRRGTMADTLGSHFKGPWALETSGDSGGQTVVGAFSTGTHGGDFNRGPLADLVVAIHLVADGGRHYWIERVDRERYNPQLTDDAALNTLYGDAKYGGLDNFRVIRDNQILNAVLVSVGRFGVIYSVVMRAVPQYSLWERRRMHLWQDVRTQIASSSPGNPSLFKDSILQKPDAKQRFLQIVVCLTPHLNFMRNLAAVTKRWEIPLAMAPAGKEQRVGVASGPVDRPHFTMAGNSHAYTPADNHPERAGSPGMLAKACTSGSFISGVISAAKDEIEEFVATHGVEVGVGIGAIAAAGGGGLIALLGPLALAALLLKELLDALSSDDRMGEAMEKVKNKLLDPSEPDPAQRAANLFAWQLIAYGVFQAMQGDQDAAARSYAIMETHDYLDVSCQHNVASVEVFFDADDSRLIAFVDALIAFEIQQEMEGKACLGYASLRFMGETQALIGPQQWWRTCAVEVSGIKDVSGSLEMVEYATALALNPNMGAILHWGQNNPSTRPQVEMRFGPNLTAWRAVLAQFNGGGGFSSEFSRRTGLEP